jgi:flagellin
MSVINTNTKSIVAQNALTANNRAMSKAMEQLSTGKRINSASDDAAGLAISSKMTAQINGLNQAVRNANDGISLLQTADGAMVEVTNMLQRMRELAVQSSNDTNTVDDRLFLDNEYQQLKTEINRIGTNTQWNGMNILNGNDNFGTVAVDEQSVQFQVGANASQTINVLFKDMTFTAANNTATPSVTTINFAAVTAEDDTGRFKATIGIGGSAINVDINLSARTATTGADPSNANLVAIAGDLQTGMRQLRGLENITVSVTNELMTITDSSGRAIDVTTGTLGFRKADGTTASMPGAVITTANGTATTAAAPSGGTFTADLAGSQITTKSASNLSVGFLDTAIQSVNSERSKFGAVINRLNYAADNLSNVSQNTSASRSRILDTDYAQATTELARTQIISQAATAMLAQANQAPQTVLSLLR